MPETVEELKDKISALEKANAYLESKVAEYEEGDSSLYYAVQRKMKELSKILNKHDLAGVDIDDKNNKSFERLSAILEKCEKYALSASALGARVGINTAPASTGQPEAIVKRITTPESISDVLRNTAGQNS
jgi:exonuclease VII small subunit